MVCVHCVRLKEEVKLSSLEVVALLTLIGMLKSPRMMAGTSDERK